MRMEIYSQAMKAKKSPENPDLSMSPKELITVIVSRIIKSPMYHLSWPIVQRHSLKAWICNGRSNTFRTCPQADQSKARLNALLHVDQGNHQRKSMRFHWPWRTDPSSWQTWINGIWTCRPTKWHWVLMASYTWHSWLMLRTQTKTPGFIKSSFPRKDMSHHLFILRLYSALIWARKQPRA